MIINRQDQKVYNINKIIRINNSERNAESDANNN